MTILQEPEGSRISNTELVQRIQNYLDTNYDINTLDLLKFGKAFKINRSLITKRFGSIENCRAHFGVNIARHIFTKEKVESIIKLMSEKYDISKRNIELHGKEFGISTQPIITLYGSIGKMKQELGYEVRDYNYSKEDVSQKLINFYISMGSISKDTLTKENIVNHKVIRRIWGNFEKMYQELFPEILETNRYISKSCLQTLLVINKLLNEEPQTEAKFDWLINPDTKHNLRIDAYYPKANIAVEFHRRTTLQVCKTFSQNDGCIFIQAKLRSN